MTDKFGLFDIEEDAPSEPVLRLPSTPETRARYSLLKSKRLGECWQEGDVLYRKGSNGSTVFNFDALK